MSSCRDSTSVPVCVSSAELRRSLERALPTDALLDGFCIDCFPSVYRQFSSGMERTRKLNLLLASTPLAELLLQLQSYVPMEVEHDLMLPGRSREAASAQRKRPIHPSHRARMVLAWLAGPLALAALTGAAMRSPCQRMELPSAHDRVPPEPPLAPVPKAPSLTSEPSAALVYAVPSGRLLGQTPWVPPADALWESLRASGLRVCVRRPGFVPVLVTLEPGPSGVHVVPVHLRLQSQARAAPWHEPNQEACNVPTPIPD